MLDAFPSSGRDLGLRAYEGRVDDLSPAGLARRAAERRRHLAELAGLAAAESRRRPTATTWPWSWPRRSCCWPGASRPAGTRCGPAGCWG